MDQDGYGDNEAILEACESRDNYIAVGNDCDDGNASVYPSAQNVR